MDKLKGKVALITGAARGQGRSHAVTFAEEGADIVAIDMCKDLPSVPYGLASAEDLEETVRLVEGVGRKIVSKTADIRDRDGLGAAISDAVGEIGRLDVVCANAGICSMGNAAGGDPVAHMAHEMAEESWDDMIAINLTGQWNTAKAVVPHLLDQKEGGSIIFTASTAGLRGFPNMAHYSAAKFGVIGLMKSMANELAAEKIRVNAVCPTSVDTPMANYPAIWKLFRPDLENPQGEDARGSFAKMNLMPVSLIEPRDISAACLYLASDDSRYVTGHALPVDAGNIAMFGVNATVLAEIDS